MKASLLFTAFLLAVLNAPYCIFAAELTFNAPVSGVLDGEKKQILGNPGIGVWYQTELTLSLKAGQSVKLSASVIGKDRLVSLVLVDRTGAPATDPVPKHATTYFEVVAEEVNVTGKYTLVVISSEIGPFTVEAVPVPLSLWTLNQLEQRKQRLMQEIAEIDAAIKATQK